ncbi:ribonuclease Z [Geobacter pickeringii]|uniref:Ribonuclease Z n=1 Tax=Geobacter pickeringii TaxID=345632 RepID=A0A0B5B852_9BACT|nr:MBL fold metallo-hydrolase [Geobacter pickeringii]AJE02813.1 ribonuclease Z [Geobacter pickeringii]
MTPQFHPSLVNGPFDDPALYVDFLFERRALLFDLGDITPLSPRKVLRISHIFVSHTHVDHFIGFDRLVRLCLGREKELHLFGPPGFVGQVGHRLAGYTWNLVESYPTDFTVVATELHVDGTFLTDSFRCRKMFAPEGERHGRHEEGVILDEEGFLVRAAFLDHGIPCLAFALEEKNHVNIMKNRLDELGLPTGAWLKELKRAILAGNEDGEAVTARWREGDGWRERTLSLGELRRQVARVVAGQKVAYVTDAAPTRENGEAIVALAGGADHLFIETTFLHHEAERAGERRHLTARLAGELGRRAGAARVIPFHFSPKYRDREEAVRREVAEAFNDEG